MSPISPRIPTGMPAMLAQVGVTMEGIGATEGDLTLVDVRDIAITGTRTPQRREVDLAFVDGRRIRIDCPIDALREVTEP